MSLTVKGFRTPASQWRDEMLGGRRPKKPQGRKPRGEFAPAVVSFYGDLACVYAPIFGYRTGIRGSRPLNLRTGRPLLLLHRSPSSARACPGVGPRLGQ